MQTSFPTTPASNNGHVRVAIALGAYAAWVTGAVFGLAALAGLCAAYAGALLLALGVRLARSLRGPARSLERSRKDHATGLYNRDGLLAHADARLVACRRDTRPLALVVLNCSDLLEVREIYGSAIGRKLLLELSRKLRAVAGEAGVAARTGPAEFTLALPGLDREGALQSLRSVLGSPARLEFESGDVEVVLVPELALGLAAWDAASVAGLQASLCEQLAERQQYEESRQRYLTRERERHSRPMGLVSVPDRPLRVPGALTVPANRPRERVAAGGY